jgi:hypothetical protein
MPNTYKDRVKGEREFPTTHTEYKFEIRLRAVIASRRSHPQCCG